MADVVYGEKVMQAPSHKATDFYVVWRPVHPAISTTFVEQVSRSV